MKCNYMEWIELFSLPNGTKVIGQDRKTKGILNSNDGVIYFSNLKYTNTNQKFRVVSLTL